MLNPFCGTFGGFSDCFQNGDLFWCLKQTIVYIFFCYIRVLYLQYLLTIYLSPCRFPSGQVSCRRLQRAWLGQALHRHACRWSGFSSTSGKWILASGIQVIAWPSRLAGHKQLALDLDMNHVICSVLVPLTLNSMPLIEFPIRRLPSGENERQHDLKACPNNVEMHSNAYQVHYIMMLAKGRR